MPVSTDDYASISDFMARYCWLVDEGDGDGWAALWTEDGVFAGAMPEPVAGREALRMIPLGSGSKDGPMRHMVVNLACDYRDSGRDEVAAQYYNFVTDWSDGGSMRCIALSRIVLTRNGKSWLIRRSDNVLMMG